jgi:hypothetical protein
MRRQRRRSKTAMAGALQAYAAHFAEWRDKGYHAHLICHTRTHAERFQSLHGAVWNRLRHP